MNRTIVRLIGLSSLLLLPIAGNGAALTPLQQTVRPLAVPADTRQILPKDVSLYRLYGYSAWQLGPGVDEGRRLDLMPPGYTGATNAAKLLSFFSMSDIHIIDKESPAQVPFFGWSAPFHGGGLYASAYSRGFAIGASRVIGITALADTTSYAYNAELVKQLSPAMRAKIAGYGARPTVR
jgi:hypothetical protein